MLTINHGSKVLLFPDLRPVTVTGFYLASIMAGLGGCVSGAAKSARAASSQHASLLALAGVVLLLPAGFVGGVFLFNGLRRLLWVMEIGGGIIVLPWRVGRLVRSTPGDYVVHAKSYWWFSNLSPGPAMFLEHKASGKRLVALWGSRVAIRSLEECGVEVIWHELRASPKPLVQP